MAHRPNAKSKTIKPLEDNIGKNLRDLGHDKDILDTTPKAQIMEEEKKLMSWTLLKLKAALQKTMSTQLEDKPMEKIFAKDTSARTLLPETYKNKPS